jgi:hypothetical protein
LSEYEPGMKTITIHGVERTVRVVAETGCWHLCAKHGGKVMRSLRPVSKLPDGSWTRTSRLVVGLMPGDAGVAICTCFDKRCCNKDHLTIGQPGDVQRKGCRKLAEKVGPIPKMIRLVGGTEGSNVN